MTHELQDLIILGCETTDDIKYDDLTFDGQLYGLLKQGTLSQLQFLQAGDPGRTILPRPLVVEASNRLNTLCLSMQAGTAENLESLLLLRNLRVLALLSGPCCCWSSLTALTNLEALSLAGCTTSCGMAVHHVPHMSALRCSFLCLQIHLWAPPQLASMLA